MPAVPARAVFLPGGGGARQAGSASSSRLTFSTWSTEGTFRADAPNAPLIYGGSRLRADQDNFKRAGAVHALNPFQLNVTGR